ncbi:hypothetical protein M231_01241 [Tremella mesenterica]|uniref:GAF domain-containing protein n=1 Tax=Tremella mesenterica TaxID=5217 RepID=A0A4Q1BTW5_TREME|nr:hypothetical protein M231_01241 [Tremella mesenterica]
MQDEGRSRGCRGESFYILHQSKLFVGPYHGKPACVEINLFGKSVCATAFRHGAVIVPNVDKWEGHIACDGETKSEIVIPLIITVKDGNSKSIGVLDLDSTLLNKFDEDDLNGLRGVVDTLVSMTDWQPFFSMV